MKSGLCRVPFPTVYYIKQLFFLVPVKKQLLYNCDKPLRLKADNSTARDHMNGLLKGTMTLALAPPPQKKMGLLL